MNSSEILNETDKIEIELNKIIRESRQELSEEELSNLQNALNRIEIIKDEIACTLTSVDKKETCIRNIFIGVITGSFFNIIRFNINIIFNIIASIFLTLSAIILTVNLKANKKTIDNTNTRLNNIDNAITKTRDRLNSKAKNIEEIPTEDLSKDKNTGIDLANYYLGYLLEGVEIEIPEDLKDTIILILKSDLESDINDFDTLLNMAKEKYQASKTNGISRSI